ncbi:mersacidin/lichenicidin family type 2 lantibiotic [Streptomyces sp. NPDC005549]|uniref:mersacidin/lichenicidin family type 2 lantibiotic n=1 Tax=Streptomyces sp. NPDC005549 TaxID=3154888 RepID=UPI0033A16307
MSVDIVRSWKDADYRLSLGSEAPAHPSGDGLTAITDEELTEVNGAGSGVLGTLGCCSCLPWYSGWTVCGLACNPGKPCKN